MQYYDTEKSEKEYIEFVVEISKMLFNRSMGVDFFKDDNLRVAYCNFEDKAVVYEEFCEKFFPLYLNECYSRTAPFSAQAFTNTIEGVYGILICLDIEQEPKEWFQIILHEMSHIYCIAHEIGGDNFSDKYSKDNLGNTSDYWYINLGYTIWREFIADYIAAPINPLMAPLSLTELREVVRELDEELYRSNPNMDSSDRADNCSLILVYIFLNRKIRMADDIADVFEILEKNRIFATRDRINDYHIIICLIFEQLRKEPYWEIDSEFVKKIGMAYFCSVLLAE